MLLYWGLTKLEHNEKGEKIIYWYCPERIKPVAPYDQIVEDFHSYPDEPTQLTEFEQKLYYDTFTEEERKLLLTDLEKDSPDYIEGLDLKKEEVEFFKNFCYSKDEARRCVNEFFTEEEIDLLESYLAQEYGFRLEKMEITCPLDKFELASHCRDPWDCEEEADYLLHYDPNFLLDIPVEGIIEQVYKIEVYIKDGRMHFKENEGDS